MGQYLGFVLRYGKQNLCNAMPDIVLHDIFHEQERKQHSYAGINDVKEIVGLTVKP